MAEKRQSDVVVAIETSLIMVGSLFLVEAVETLFHLHLARFGIVPRTQAGLPGIVFSPLLHANWQHLLANALPLLVLMVLLLTNRRYHPWRTLLLIWVASGLGTWLIGRGQSTQIGASSIVFGLAAFLITAGFLMKSWQSAGVAALVFFLYGGIFYGVLPQNGPISWEGHLCGAIAGAWTANHLRG